MKKNLGYMKGEAKVSRVVRFEASCTAYTVVVTPLGANTLVADETGRWAAYVPTRSFNYATDLALELYSEQAGSTKLSTLDCENIAKALVEGY